MPKTRKQEILTLVVVFTGVLLASALVVSLVMLWILEWREPEQVFRSMELKVTTTNVVSTHGD